jgi:hypothetical protein
MEQGCALAAGGSGRQRFRDRALAAHLATIMVEGRYSYHAALWDGARNLRPAEAYASSSA